MTENLYDLAQQVWKDRDWLIDRRADCQVAGADDYLIRYQQAAIDAMAETAVAMEQGDWEAWMLLSNMHGTYPEPPLAPDYTNYAARVGSFAAEYLTAINHMLGLDAEPELRDVVRADVLP